MSRAAQLDCQHLRSCALVLTLFLFQKGQGFFPPLPIAALLRRSRRGAYLPRAGWDASVWVGKFCGVDEWADFLFPQLAVGILTPCRLDGFPILDGFSAQNNEGFCFPAVGGGQAYPLGGGMLRCSLNIFATQKASGISNPRWPF